MNTGSYTREAILDDRVASRWTKAPGYVKSRHAKCDEVSLKATEVFTPGAFPLHTYVERAGETLEASLRDALETPGQVVSLIGPSKSGKTVLVEKVVGRDSLITVTGAGIESAEMIWARALDWMGAPTSSTSGATVGGKLSAKAGAAAEAGIVLAKASTAVEAAVEIGHEREHVQSYERSGLAQVVKEISGSGFVILVDDFHYMPRNVQASAAKSIKEAVRLGVKARPWEEVRAEIQAELCTIRR
jgi:hypothetical protein